MYLEEHTVRDLPQLPVSHPFYWLEGQIKSPKLGLGKKPAHDAEHEEQLKYWGCDPKHTSKLTIRKDDDGVFFADRLYHIMLHLLYWKLTEDKDEARQEAWQRFEAESNFKLEELTLPKPSDKGHEAY